MRTPVIRRRLSTRDIRAARDVYTRRVLCAAPCSLFILKRRAQCIRTLSVYSRRARVDYAMQRCQPPTIVATLCHRCRLRDKMRSDARADDDSADIAFVTRG